MGFTVLAEQLGKKEYIKILVETMINSGKGGKTW